MVPSELSPTQCPLCGRLNRCAMEIARESGAEPGRCWCMDLDFSAELLAKVPAAAVRRACICEDCARAQEA